MLVRASPPRSRWSRTASPSSSRRRWCSSPSPSPTGSTSPTSAVSTPLALIEAYVVGDTLHVGVIDVVVESLHVAVAVYVPVPPSFTDVGPLDRDAAQTSPPRSRWSRTASPSSSRRRWCSSPSPSPTGSTSPQRRQHAARTDRGVRRRGHAPRRGDRCRRRVAPRRRRRVRTGPALVHRRRAAADRDAAQRDRGRSDGGNEPCVCGGERRLLPVSRTAFTVK